MKAVVMEIKDRYMVVLDCSGRFQRLKYDYVSRIGDEIDMTAVNRMPAVIFKKLAAAAAIFLFTLCSGYGAVSYYTPYAYVDIDINPSVELVLNRYLRVINVQSLNDDGARVVTNVSDIKNNTMDNAVGILLENAEKQKFIADDRKNVVVFTVSGINDEPLENIRDRLKNTAKTKLNKLIEEEDIITEKITQKKRNDARKLKISPGRLILFEKLKEVKPDTRMEDIENRPVRDTVREIREYREKEREIRKDTEKINDRNGDKKDKSGPAKETLQNKIKEVNEKIQKDRKERDEVRGREAEVSMEPKRQVEDIPDMRQDTDNKKPDMKTPESRPGAGKEKQSEPGRRPGEDLRQEGADREETVPRIRNQVPEEKSGNGNSGAGRGEIN